MPLSTVGLPLRSVRFCLGVIRFGFGFHSGFCFFIRSTSPIGTPTFEDEILLVTSLSPTSFQNVFEVLLFSGEHITTIVLPPLQVKLIDPLIVCQLHIETALNSFLLGLGVRRQELTGFARRFLIDLKPRIKISRVFICLNHQLRESQFICPQHLSIFPIVVFLRLCQNMLTDDSSCVSLRNEGGRNGSW